MVSERVWLIKDKNDYKRKCEQLQNNWNELKKLIEERINDIKKNLSVSAIIMTDELDGLRFVKRQMEELEEGKDENN